MKIFGRKAAANAGRARGAKQKEGQLSSSHRVTLDLYRAEVLAAMMAKSRSSGSIEITDLLAGMYISNWERLSRYWANSKQEDVEMLLRRICRISPQRWHSWIESYQASRGDSAKRVWQRLRRSKNGKAADDSPRAFRGYTIRSEKCGKNHALPRKIRWYFDPHPDHGMCSSLHPAKLRLRNQPQAGRHRH